MFKDNVKPGDSIRFIDRLTSRVLINIKLRTIEFTQHGQFIRVDAVVGGPDRPVHEFRVNPHRQLSFPDKARSSDIGCIEFYDPELEYNVCTVPVVINSSEGISIHVDHADALTEAKQ
ncbi:MAG TPA: hypothetical protein VLH60_04020 [Sedimentisphaerales bacterium]|nr:hypothetical protein [Sedimentisphaerales bacterium]